MNATLMTCTVPTQGLHVSQSPVACRTFLNVRVSESMRPGAHATTLRPGRPITIASSCCCRIAVAIHPGCCDAGTEAILRTNLKVFASRGGPSHISQLASCRPCRPAQFGELMMNSADPSTRAISKCIDDAGPDKALGGTCLGPPPLDAANRCAHTLSRVATLHIRLRLCSVRARLRVCSLDPSDSRPLDARLAHTIGPPK
jgi:hypothetical protein